MSTGFHYEILKCLLKESAWLEPPLLHNERGLPHKSRISAFWLFSWDSAVLVPEIHPSPALLQHSGCFLGFLLFCCRRSTLLRHCFSILAVFLGFCCSTAGDPPFSGTASAFWLFSWVSAVLVPKIHPSPALFQHSGCFHPYLTNKRLSLKRQPLAVKTNYATYKNLTE